MQDQRDQRIIMFTRVAYERAHTHADHEHKDITKGDGQWMPYGEIDESFEWRHFQVFPFRHDREGPDARAEQFGIVVVVVIVGSFPYAAWSKHIHSKDFHNDIGGDGMG